MYVTITRARECLHRGSFAGGQADPSVYPDDQRVGSFAVGEEASDGAYAEVGDFAEGQADPVAYPGEDHEGTFAAGM